MSKVSRKGNVPSTWSYQGVTVQAYNKKEARGKIKTALGISKGRLPVGAVVTKGDKL